MEISSKPNTELLMCTFITYRIVWSHLQLKVPRLVVGDEEEN